VRPRAPTPRGDDRAQRAATEAPPGKEPSELLPASQAPAGAVLDLQRGAGTSAVARLLAGGASKPARPLLQRLGAKEHLYIGDEATRTGPALSRRSASSSRGSVHT
jgi:hypothetical protein